MDPITVIGHWDNYELIHRVRAGEEAPFAGAGLPALRKGGVRAVFFAAGGDSRSHAAGSDLPLRGSLERLDLILGALEASGDAVVLLRTREDVESLEGSQIGFLLMFEGGRPLEGSIAILHQLYRLGVRSLTLTWNGRNELADGVGEGPDSGGLSQFGKVVVKEMKRLGMMLDVSHLNEKGFWEALSLWDGPIIASHSNATRLHDHRRNITDDQIKAIGRTGGMVGIAFMPAFLGPGIPTANTIIDHIAHIAGLIGIEGVGIGPDFSYGPVAAEHRRSRKYEGITVNLEVPYPISDPSQLPLLAESLRARGFQEEEIRAVMGENCLRVLREILPSANLGRHPSSPGQQS